MTGKEGDVIVQPKNHHIWQFWHVMYREREGSINL
jgi:hypothetical protein